MKRRGGQQEEIILVKNEKQYRLMCHVTQNDGSVDGS